VVASNVASETDGQREMCNIRSKTVGSAPHSKRELRKESIREWQKEWQESNNGSWTKRLIKERVREVGPPK